MNTVGKVIVGGLVIGGIIAGLVIAGKQTEAAFDPWSYDKDGDGYISMSEALAAVHDAVYGKITQAQAEAVIALKDSGVHKG